MLTRTRFPLTVMCLRCMNEWSQGAREFQVWFARHVETLRSGDSAVLRPNWERMRDGMWLDEGDPC